MRHLTIFLLGCLLSACGPDPVGAPTPLMNTAQNTQASAPAVTKTASPTVLPSAVATSTPSPAVEPTATATADATATAVATATADATGTPTSAPSPTPLPQGPITFIDGEDGDVFTAKDVLLNSYQDAALLNTGTHANFELSPTQNGLLEFDLSSIPAGSNCLSATLVLVNSYGSGGGTPVSTIYALSEADADWEEGTLSLEQALPGETSWDAKAADGRGGIAEAWAGDVGRDGGADAGASVRGLDYQPDPIGQFAWNPNDPLATVYEIPLDPQQVEDWFGPDNQNYGIVILTVGGGGHVGQSDHHVPEYRPKLVVVYETAE